MSSRHVINLDCSELDVLATLLADAGARSPVDVPPLEFAAFSSVENKVAMAVRRCVRDHYITMSGATPQETILGSLPKDGEGDTHA